MRLDEAKKIILENNWKEAKTKKHPHSYLWHTSAKNIEDFKKLELFIWNNGIKGTWFEQEYIYLIINQELFWTMTSPLTMPINEALKISQIINRASIWNMSGWSFINHSRNVKFYRMPMGFVSEKSCKHYINAQGFYVDKYKVIEYNGYYFFIDEYNYVIGMKKETLIYCLQLKS